MPVPELPSFDAKRFRDVLKDKLGDFRVWQQFVDWKLGVDRLNKIVAEHDARLLRLEGAAPPPDPEPEPEPPPEPPLTRYAPRAYNSTPSADARFCMAPAYGVQRQGDGTFIDQKGIRYDEAGRDLGGRTTLQVPELKGANSMDGREPCDQYVGPTGRTIGGAAGYPPASFER